MGARGYAKTAAGQAKRAEVARRVKASGKTAPVQAVKPTAESTEEVITPEQAAVYLEGNRNNRSIRDKVVDKYAEDMKAGRWKMNGSTIVFDESGNLLDGQHRLWGCFQSGVPFRTLVVRGVEAEAFTTIDTGVPRPATDIFTIAGETNVGALTAATRLLWRYEHGLIDGGTRKEAISSQMLLEYLNEHKTLRDSVDRAAHIPNLKKLMTASGAAFAHYLLTRAGGDAAEKFLYALGKGDGLEANSPIFRAREALVNSLARRANRRAEWAVAVAIKAWNLHRQGKTAKIIAWSPTKNEDFPRPVL